MTLLHEDGTFQHVFRLHICYLAYFSSKAKLGVVITPHFSFRGKGAFINDNDDKNISLHEGGIF